MLKSQIFRFALLSYVLPAPQTVTLHHIFSSTHKRDEIRVLAITQRFKDKYGICFSRNIGSALPSALFFHVSSISIV
jgi:hypothetical protein